MTARPPTRIALLPATLLALLVGVIGCASAPTSTRGAPTDAGPHDLRLRTPVSLRYRDSSGSGPALVLVHGNFDSLETWAGVVPLLSSHFRVITLDLPGFGESDNPFGTWTYTSLAVGIRLVLDDLGVERATLVGNSLGGGVVAAFAVAYPDRVAGVGLEDANFLGVDLIQPTPEATRVLGALFSAANKLKARSTGAPAPATSTGEAPVQPAQEAALELRDATRAALRVVLRAPDAVDDALVERYARGFEGHRFTAVTSVNAATAASLEDLSRAFEQAMRDRNLPMAILWGLDDPILQPVHADLIKARHPSARLVLFAGAGHAPHLERPSDFAAALIETFGPTPVTRDTCLPSPHEPLTAPATTNQYPFVERAIRDTLTRSPGADPGQLQWLALNQLATGAFDEAMATIDRFPKTWPAANLAYADFVRGAALEARGDLAAATASYLAALGAMVPDARPMALARLARLPLDATQAAVVDPLLATPPGERESTALLIARIDRLLARDRWEDALDLLDRYTIVVPFMQSIALRRAVASLGAGRPAPDPNVDTDELRVAAAKHRLASPRERPTLVAIERCKLSFWEQLRYIDEMGPRPFQVCKSTPVGRLDFLSGPPPRVTAWTEPGTSLGALALARAALSEGRDADARAALEAVAADRTTQTPELHRLRLALIAPTSKRAAITEATALSKAHGDAPAWRRVLATTLSAAGKLREARDLLAALVLLTPTASLREELAYVEAALGHDVQAKALLDALRTRDRYWQGSPVRALPHLRPYAERLWSAK